MCVVQDCKFYKDTRSCFFTGKKQNKNGTMKSKSPEATIAGGSIWRWLRIRLLEVAVGRGQGVSWGPHCQVLWASALPSCRNGLHLGSKAESRTAWSNPSLWTWLTKYGLCSWLPLGVCSFHQSIPTSPPKYDRFGSIQKKIPNFCFLCGRVNL